MGRASREKRQRLRETTLPTGEPEPRPEGPWLHPLLVLLLLAALAVVIYFRTFSAPFQFDDTNNIVENPDIQILSRAFELTGSRFLGYLSFALNYRFGGLDVFGYHLVNVLIHIANGFLVYALVLLLMRSAHCSPLTAHGGWIALTAALLFVAHPVQTQAVTYIVQRFASLVTLFYLLSVVAYLKWKLFAPEGRARFLWYAVALVSCVLAMRTKENSFTLPLMIVLMEFVFFRPLDRKRWMSLVPFLLTLPIVPFSLGQILGEAEGFAQDTDEIGRMSYLFTQFRVIVTYLRLLVLPVGQSLDHDQPLYHSLWAPPVLLSFLFLLSLLGLAVFLLRRGPRERLVGFGILWFFLALSIESSVIPIKDVIFEHRVYLPSVGLFLAASAGWLWGQGRAVSWKSWKQGVAALAVLAVLILAGAAYRRNGVWADPITLWKDVVAKAPNKARGHANLGTGYAGKGLIEESIRSFEAALKIQPDYYQARNNLGSSYVAQGRVEEAIREYEAALALEPNYPEAYYNLAVAFEKLGRIEEAIRQYQKAIERQPRYVKARNNLATVYAKQGRLEEAAREYEAVLKLKPDYAGAHNNLGNVYYLLGRVQEAVERYRTALKLQPDFPEVRKNLDKAVKETGR